MKNSPTPRFHPEMLPTSTHPALRSTARQLALLALELDPRATWEALLEAQGLPASHPIDASESAPSRTTHQHDASRRCIRRIVRSGRGSEYSRFCLVATLEALVQASIRCCCSAWDSSLTAADQTDAVFSFTCVRTRNARAVSLEYAGREAPIGLSQSALSRGLLAELLNERRRVPKEIISTISVRPSEIDSAIAILTELPAANVDGKPLGVLCRERELPAGIGVSGLPIAQQREDQMRRRRGTATSAARILRIAQALGMTPDERTIEDSAWVETLAQRMVAHMIEAIASRTQAVAC
jgi:hypothetical protein